MHPSSHLTSICFLLLAKLHGAKAVDTATVSITSLAQFSVEPACVQSCMYYNSFGVADYLLFALGCTSTIYNECYCTQIQDQRASTALSTCINTMCSGTTEIAPAQSLYESYCSVAGYPRNAAVTQTSSSSASSPVSQSAAPTASSPSPTTTSAVTSPPSASIPSSSQSSSSVASSPSTAKSKSKTGPIVGGVVGGLAALALIIGLVFLFLRSQRQKSPQTQHQEAAAIPAPILPSAEQPEKRTVPPVSPVSAVSAKVTHAAVFKKPAGGRAELGDKEDETIVNVAPAVVEVHGDGRHGLRPDELDAEGRYIGELHGDGRHFSGSELS